MILYEGPSLIDPGVPIVVIATEDENPKTGRMLFTWILRQDRPPEVAAYDGSDAAICGDCKFRAINGEVLHHRDLYYNDTPTVSDKEYDDLVRKARLCYVRLSPAEGADEAFPPSEVWKKWRAKEFYGGVQIVSSVVDTDSNTEWMQQIEGTTYWQYRGHLPVRIGSYGDPAAVPTRVWAELVRYAKNWTGYTHMWKPVRCRTCTGVGAPIIFCDRCNDTRKIDRCDPNLKKYCMASVDSPEERAEAQALGWRTFFVVPEAESRYYPTLNMLNERQDILCPATDPKRGKVCRHCDGEGWRDIGPDDEDGNLTIETCIECNGAGRVSTTCAVCGLCRGTSANCPSIWEIVHGKNKENHKW